MVPWWLRYNFGIAQEADLRNRIVQLSSSLGLDHKIVNKIVRHAVSEFSKRGLGADYYGYHNIDHELEVTFFTLLAAKGKGFSQKDLVTLFIAALFHDYDPLKRFDKPNEDSIEKFIRNDHRIVQFIRDLGISVDIVIALIYRTAYPFKGKIAEDSSKRIQELFSAAGIPGNDSLTRKHYEDLGWFLSVSERVAGYALDDFEHALKLARRNAHGLGWHPSRINKESVKFFSLLNKEKTMLNLVLDGISNQCRENYSNNILKFKESFLKEIEIKNAVRKKEINLVFKSEDNETIDSTTLREILNLYNELDNPLEINNEKKFTKSIKNLKTILVTLRLNESNGKVIGFAKGGPL
ncbi:MAG TPA: HD domain-containing protein, partial [Candidatus Nitrosopolaris sp.]|nr:HD domain-containing protein [Candidatus Nitrosopolaris sp.]